MMPRQPLPIKLHEGPWSIGPQHVEARPEHVAIIGRCMTFWPDVLHTMGLLLGILLGARSEGAVAMFSTFRNARQRREALIAAAETVLDDQALEVCNAVLTIVGSAEKERDHLAHGCYGASTAIEDGILWIESKHVGPWNVAMLLKDPDRTGTEHAELAQRIFVYRKADLEEVYREIQDAWEATFKLLSFVGSKISNAPNETRDELYRQLCILPRVATVLSRIRAGTKNTP